MTFDMTRIMRGATLSALVLLASCGLPRSGPSKSEIYSGSVLRQGDSFVITVTDRVNQIANGTTASGFSEQLRSAGRVGADTIRPGDVLSLSIWENVEDGLLGGGGRGATTLSDIQVDDRGYIFVPYAGRIRAAGNAPEALRRVITNKLKDQTPDPQVQVMLQSGDGAAVTVLGTGGGQGVVPIARDSRTLAQLLAKVGGVQSEPGDLSITVVRGNLRETILASDLLSDPRQDIAMRDGDTLIVEKAHRSFTALGATGGQSQVPLEKGEISALEAIAQVGGLSPTRADPTGVFVLRNESEAVTEAITGVDVTGVQRVIYVLNLTVPNGMFMARDFAIRDKDTVYVTEAPFVQFNKTIAAITGGLGNVNKLASTAQSAVGQ